ncbi:MAG: hypothetical protein JXA21_26565, partial [Anaerolineae bacterium]|nr:hypothetical protein [Anaerolineae bacterium]
MDKNHGLAGQGLKGGFFAGGGTRPRKTPFYPRFSGLFSREFIINLRFTSGWMKIAIQRKKDRVFFERGTRSKKHSLFNPPPRWRRLFQGNSSLTSVHQRLDENHSLAGQEVKVGYFCGRYPARKSTLFKPRVS